EAAIPPSKPFPVPWLAGCGGISVRATSALLVSALLVSALAITAVEVSGTSARGGEIELVIGVVEPAEASFICPALICTVLTLTGFIGSGEPGSTGGRWGCN